MGWRPERIGYFAFGLVADDQGLARLRWSKAGGRPFPAAGQRRLPGTLSRKPLTLNDRRPNFDPLGQFSIGANARPLKLELTPETEMIDTMLLVATGLSEGKSQTNW